MGVFDFRLGGGSDLFYVNQRKSVPSVSSAFLYPNNEVSFTLQMLILIMVRLQIWQIRPSGRLSYKFVSSLVFKFKGRNVEIS